jgi:hypothetical protein
MNAYDFNVAIPHGKGSLATLAEEMGREKVNIEGLSAIEQNGDTFVHIATTDKAATSRVINKVGYRVIRETEVIVERVDDRPGMLGTVTRRLTDAGIKLTTVYLATDTRLVLGSENTAALKSAWKDLAAVASR